MHFKQEIDLLKTVILSLLVWSLLIPCTIGSIVYRTVIDLILRLKHGRKYGGLFEVKDSYFFSPDALRSWACSITTVLYIKCDKKTDIFVIIRKILQQKVASVVKLNKKYLTWGFNRSLINQALTPNLPA